MYVFSIYDTVAEDWSTPFCAKNIEHLKRVLSNVFRQGVVLEECYVSCIAYLDADGVVIYDEDKLCIFDFVDGADYYPIRTIYLHQLYEKELKEKEVKENG